MLLIQALTRVLFKECSEIFFQRNFENDHFYIRFTKKLRDIQCCNLHLEKNRSVLGEMVAPWSFKVNKLQQHPLEEIWCSLSFLIWFTTIFIRSGQSIMVNLNSIFDGIVSVWWQPLGMESGWELFLEHVQILHGNQRISVFGTKFLHYMRGKNVFFWFDSFCSFFSSISTTI